MKIVVSPAKTLDLKSKLPTSRATQPQFIEEAEKINNKLERMSKSDLSKLMGISDKPVTRRLKGCAACENRENCVLARA